MADLNRDNFVNILHPLWARARILAAVGALICPCGGYWGAQHPGTLCCCPRSCEGPTPPLTTFWLWR